MSRKELDDFDGILYLHSQIQRLAADERTLLKKSGIGWTPLADIFETDSKFLIMVEIPGVRKEDVEVVLESQELQIRGMKRPEIRTSTECFHQMERQFGEFRRTFQFDVSIDPERIDAVIKHGMLTVTVSKEDKTEPREIGIK